MKLTKFQHACLVIEDKNETIIIDPGVLSRDFIMPSHVSAVVVTHSHPDHFDQNLVEKILTKFPEASLIAHETITSKLPTRSTIAVNAGVKQNIGEATLQFFGGTHAPISDSVQVPPNLGVLVNESLYYPGDSFVNPERENLRLLALPVSAPWLRIDDTLQFLKQVRPLYAFPTHDAILSDDGKGLIDALVSTQANEHGVQYERLDGKTIEL